MTLFDLYCVYKCYNDLEIIKVDKDNNTIETITGEKAVLSQDKTLWGGEVLGMRAYPIQSEENAYFMDNEMRMMVKAKVKVWVRYNNEK